LTPWSFRGVSPRFLTSQCRLQSVKLTFNGVRPRVAPFGRIRSRWRTTRTPNMTFTELSSLSASTLMKLVQIRADEAYSGSFTVFGNEGSYIVAFGLPALGFKQAARLESCASTLAVRWRLTSGHSSSRMLKNTESRRDPSRVIRRDRKIPSSIAPIAANAFRDRILRLSV